MAADASPFSVKEDPDRSPPPSPSPPSTGSPNYNSSPNRRPKSNPTKTELSTSPPPPLDLPPSTAPPPQPPPSTTSASSRRLPPPCWTHEETLALIDSYREKWYALRRGNLRAPHWQEVANAVGGRCQHLIAASATNRKTSIQCRHKVEKLRKRYRAEKQRALRANPVNPPAPSWVYFRKMEAMELGNSASAPASSRPPSAGTRPKAVPPSYSSNASSTDDDDDDEEDEDDGYPNIAGGNSNNTRGIHATMLKANGAGDPMIDGLKFTFPKAVRSERANLPNATPKTNPNNGFFRGFPGGARPSVVEEMRKRMEKRRRKERVGDLVGEMVTAVRMLGDGFMRMEEMKMEMAREMEKLRMEMEIKRTEMILESQRQIVGAFVRGLHGKKRAKVVPES